MQEKNIRNLLKGRIPKVIGLRREYGVMILLVEKEGKLQFVLEKRSAGIKQPGDVCFPGGRVEEGETVIECALRETAEELGITQVEILGKYDSHYELSGIGMHSVIGIISEEELKNMRPNPAEVEGVFTVPMDFFAETEPLVYDYDILQDVENFPYEETGVRPDYKWRKGHQQIPIYHFDGEIIWGLTGTFIKSLTEELSENSK